jgi:transcription antitermination factor NusG
MPILDREIDLYPDDLLDHEPGSDPEQAWWAVYTRSRHEKELMRRLLKMHIGFYAPTISKRYKSPAGRVRNSFIPLFANYVFLHGSINDRYDAFTTNCVSTIREIPNPKELLHELRQIRDLINLQIPLLPESRIQPGQRVRVKSGRLKGIEGTVLRRDRELRLLVAVNFIQQGASLLLDDCELEVVS